MGRQRKARRFDPHFCVSEASLQEEAKYLRREVENYEVLAPSDVETKLVERHANCQNTWQTFCLFIQGMPERDRRILQALVFRDLWFVLELYRAYLQQISSAGVTPATARTTPTSHSPMKFAEFLFDPAQ